ncbi:NAD(P)H-hydrate dehydratase [Fimbriiglobus ruber]|uniref:ADP-dependent (S)-NAD(P)H-hydrate dehydratase n=1 Tax=Fimbriiglobus ruber TaxID=1908690 RepID=A0A225DW60_9BACT|nr:NAD(P)H-hydrate dehydratase [Fimbriiglobus ruber]OWK41876.1 NAD(P)HX epimerase / NAD(P)HX dehydratase [Fimbriiglobus ruber]
MSTDLAVVHDVPKLPPRQADSHKGTYGRVLVVAGSCGMSGAAILSGSAALRGGAGLVWVACPSEVQEIVAAGNPCYLTTSIPHHTNGTFSPSSADHVAGLAEKADVVAVGPGLGSRPDVAHLLRTLLAAKPDQPAVLDADGITSLATDPGAYSLRPGRLVMTPHPGEFAKVLGITIAEVQARREPLAAEFAAKHNVVLLLKGHQTVVTDGRRVYRNPTGNPGMATGGSGDVLTGLIAALIGQELEPFDAAVLGAWAHGRAGDLAAAELSQVALTAADLLDYLPKVFLELERGGRVKSEN